MPQLGTSILGARSLAVLDFAWGRVDRKVKIDHAEFVYEYQYGSDILGKEVKLPYPFGKYSPAENGTNIVFRQRSAIGNL